MSLERDYFNRRHKDREKDRGNVSNDEDIVGEAGVLRNQGQKEQLKLKQVESWAYFVINPSVVGRWENMWKRTSFFLII